MPTATEIKAKWLNEHNQLGKQKDAPDKEAFDKAHQQLWAQCDAELFKRLESLKLIAKPTLKEQVELRELEANFLRRL